MGCTDLDEDVYSQMPVDQYGQTMPEVNSLIAPIYTGLRKANNPIMLEETSSNMSIVPTMKGGDGWEGGIYKELRYGTWTAQNSCIRKFYNVCFSEISNCNSILYMIESSEAITDKVPYTSQIRAVRAYWYYKLVDLFGNVPIVTDFTDVSKPVTKTRKDVYQFIISELNDIKDIIRADVSTSSYGKFTKGAVYTLLAKMYLNAMVWDPSEGAKWQECIDACNVVLDMPYSLEPVWKDNFITDNEDCKETILTAVNSTVSGNSIVFMTLHYLDPIALGLKIGGWNGEVAQPNYVDSFDILDKRYNGSFLIGPMIDPATGEVLITAHGRPLIHGTDFTMKYNIDADGWGQCDQEVGARCYKWEFKNGLSSALENDCAIFRLADIYLMKAEALVRMGGDNVKATNLVNDIRKRAFTDPAKLKTNVTLADIYSERRFEFAWESMTRQDEIRFGTFLDPIPGWRAAIPAKCLIFPIPQISIDANPGLVQNSGY